MNGWQLKTRLLLKVLCSTLDYNIDVMTRSVQYAIDETKIGQISQCAALTA